MAGVCIGPFKKGRGGGGYNTLLLYALPSFFAVAPDGLTETVATHNSIAVKWNKLQGRKKISYIVPAVGSQGAVHNCSVEEAHMAAICENLFPCMEYNITVRACG